jgi:outer membrane protein assembly factor BamB
LLPSESVQRPITIALLVLAACGSPAAWAWEHIVALNGEVPDIGVPAVGRGNRLFVPLTVGDIGSRTDFAVLAVSTVDGAPLWRRTIDGSNGQTGGAFAAVADRRGDVVAVGYTGDYEGGSFHQLRVVKFHGATGEVLWRPELGTGIAWHVALDRRDDVVVFARDTAHDVGRVIKLDGATGSVMWESISSAMLVGRWPILVVDRRGDVTVGGADGVRRFAGRDGTLRWWAEGPTVHALLPSSTSDVMVYEGWTTAELVARDRWGRERWRRPLQARPDLLRSNGRGDVVAVSPAVSGGYGPHPFTVTGIHHASGATMWTHEGIGGFAAPITDVAFSDSSTVTLFGWADYRGCLRALDARSGRRLWDRRVTSEANPERVVPDRRRMFAVSDAGLGVGLADVATLPDAWTWGRRLCDTR